MNLTPLAPLAVDRRFSFDDRKSQRDNIFKQDLKLSYSVGSCYIPYTLAEILNFYLHSGVAIRLCHMFRYLCRPKVCVIKIGVTDYARGNVQSCVCCFSSLAEKLASSFVLQILQITATAASWPGTYDLSFSSTALRPAIFLFSLLFYCLILPSCTYTFFLTLYFAVRDTSDPHP